MKKLWTKLLEGHVGMSGSLVIQKLSNDRIEATRVADSQGRSTTTDLNADGSIYNSIEGPPSYGEADRLIPCKILVERLNINGDHWETPIETDEVSDIDCIARDGTQELLMQVTRVPRNAVRENLSKTGNAQEYSTIEQHISDLREAIKKKEDIPIEQRRKLVLVIDAVDFPSYTYPAVVQSFREKYFDEIRKLDFKASWLVGPTTEMTVHLEEST